MPELPDRWDAYARLQERLARKHHVDDRTWGLEAGLNQLLAVVPPGEDGVERTVRSESRKERYRTNLRRIYLHFEDSARTPQHALDARLRLRRAEARVAAEEWALRYAVAEGYTYKEISTTAMVSAGTLRARVLRLRRALVA